MQAVRSLLYKVHPHSKVPLDPKTKGYTLEKQEWLEADVWEVWRVNPTNTTGSSLCKIGVDSKDQRLCVFNASNTSDKFPEDAKLKLRDILMGIWVEGSGKQPEDLRSILYQNASREDVKGISAEVHSLMKQPDKTVPLLVKAECNTIEEKAAFNRLKDDNPFGSGVQKMLHEYKGMKGKTIKEFVLAQPEHQNLQMEIRIGSV
ncbi:hypothetical protein LOZ53_002267 [Ophidiomyces ophidiicola]|nr:hypothetical protein LOZ53_002267 [Ophidiomyces ophidiicola]